MAELFKPHKDQERVQKSDEEQQFGRDFVVLGFFFIVFAGALIVFARWIFPGWLAARLDHFCRLLFCVLAVFEIHEKGLAWFATLVHDGFLTH